MRAHYLLLTIGGMALGVLTLPRRALPQSSQQRRSLDGPPTPGRLVEVGGHRLHLYWVVVEIEWSGTVRGEVLDAAGRDRTYRYSGIGLLELEDAVPALDDNSDSARSPLGDRGGQDHRPKSSTGS